MAESEIQHLSRPLLSVIIPCYNEEDSLPLILDALKHTEQNMTVMGFEFILVDDGSTDATLSVIRERAALDSEIRYLSFSRNFGKEAAMLAGMETAIGDYVCTMDADMQDSPDLLPQMYEAVAGGGYDCAAIRRSDREGESKLRSFFSRRF